MFKNNAASSLRKTALLAPLLVALSVSMPTTAHAGATFKIDETKWLSIGAGLRTSFRTTEDTAGDNDEWSTDFDIDNMRLYLNAQLHEYIKLEFNTDCQNCIGGGDVGDGGDMRILDAIAKFEFNDHFNVWFGRQLVPSDRAELDGPYFQNTYDFNKTPFYPSDFGNDQAGRFGRDDGINVWGAFLPDNRLTYVVGVFDGLDGQGNQDDNLLFAGRISYNFLNVEDNPGYYTSSTYFGKAGDVLTVSAAMQYQDDGAGSAANGADFFGYSVDALFETVLGNEGVFTAEGEYKYFNLDGLNQATLNDPGCFCIFEGRAVTGTALYLLPQEFGIGQLQPYTRFTYTDPQNSDDRWEYEAGVNYVIDGFNARISMFYQYGDIATKGRTYTPDVDGDEVHVLGLGVQLQI